MRVLGGLITLVLSSKATDAARVLTEREPVVTASDRDLAAAVKEKTDAVCSLLPDAPMSDEERESVKSTMTGVAGVDADGGHLVENILREFEPDTGQNVAQMVSDQLPPGEIVSRASTAPMAIILVIFMVLCYHQVCCRIAFKNKDTAGCNQQYKGGFTFVSGALAFAILISVFAAPAGKLTEGGNRILCTIGQMADVSMSGEVDADGDGLKEGFPGFLDVCENIDNLVGGVLAPPKLDASGDYVNPTDFVPQARKILSDTELLDKKLAVILSSLDRLRDMSKDKKNLLIDRANCGRAAAAPCSGHKNLVLTELGPKVNEVRKELAQTLAGMLGDVKDEASKFLGDDNLGELQVMVDTAMLTPLKAMKDEFITQMGEQLTSSGSTTQQVEVAMSSLEAGCNAVRAEMFVFAIAVFVCLGCLFTRAPVAGATGRDRYPRSNHCCAGFTCLGGWECVVFLCLLATAISIAALPVSSTCLVLVDLDGETLPNYPGVHKKVQDLKLDGVVEACLFPGGDGDLLGSLKVEIEDKKTNLTKEVTARDAVVEKIKGQVDEIFAPLASAPPADQDMAAMADLEKVLVLLKDVDAFYSYAHEAEADPKFQSLSGVLTDLSAEAADRDPRALEDTDCINSDPACPALAVRLRAASLTCNAYTVPPGSFDGQPDKPIPGLGSVTDSIKSYERFADGKTTSVDCVIDANNISSIQVTEAPKCKHIGDSALRTFSCDKGMCTGMCSEAHDSASSDFTSCMAFCAGELPTNNIAEEAAYDAVADANPTIKDGISDAEMDKFCPPIAALRVVDEFTAMTIENIFMCYDFDCATKPSLAECAVADAAGAYSVPYKAKACTLPALVASFVDAAADLRFSIADVQTTATEMKPAIATQLKTLMADKLVEPFLKIIDAKTMDCSFLGNAWRNFLDGACYNLGGAIAQYSNIFTLCARAGFVLVFLMFGLWRHFLNMYDAAREEAEGGGEGKTETGVDGTSQM